MESYSSNYPSLLAAKTLIWFHATAHWLLTPYEEVTPYEDISKSIGIGKSMDIGIDYYYY